FPFKGSVKVVELDLAREGGSSFRGTINNLARLRDLRRALRENRSDIIISFLPETNIRTLLATRGLGMKVIVSERTDPAGRNIGRAWDFLRRLTYPWADAVVCQGKRALSFFPSSVRGCVIPNPVNLPEDAMPKTSS